MNNITPKLSLYHPNHKGTGAAIQFELVPAHGMSEGAIYCRIAPQISIPSRFDFQNAIVAKLNFTDVCLMLQVLRGETENISSVTENINEGKGFFHKTAKGLLVVKFNHRIEPYNGYSMDFYFKNNEGKENQVGITFSMAEGLGLCEAFSASLKEIAFGTSFEATSIAIARDEAIVAEAADIAAKTAHKEREEADKSKVDKAVAKVDAIGHLCASYGAQNEELITRMLDIACGDREDERNEFCEDYRQLGMNALGKDHPVWKYIVK